MVPSISVEVETLAHPISIIFYQLAVLPPGREGDQQRFPEGGAGGAEVVAQEGGCAHNRGAEVRRALRQEHLSTVQEGPDRHELLP